MIFGASGGVPGSRTVRGHIITSSLKVFGEWKRTTVLSRFDPVGLVLLEESSHYVVESGQLCKKKTLM